MEAAAAEERKDLALLWGFLEVKRERRRCPWRGWLRPGALAGDLPSEFEPWLASVLAGLRCPSSRSSVSEPTSDDFRSFLPPLKGRHRGDLRKSLPTDDVLSVAGKSPESDETEAPSWS